MITFNERFFKLGKCVFNKKTRTARLVFVCNDNFEPEIPAHEQRITRQMHDLTGEKFEIVFEYAVPPRAATSGENTAEVLKRLQDFSETLSTAPKVDKSLAVKGIEYWCGAPTKIRPIKIKFLRNGPEPQVTGGSINFLTKREYARDGVTKDYWTFVLDDGEARLNCVFFPSAKTRAAFEKLANRTTIVVVGVKDKRGDRESFRVSGVSLCEYMA